MDRWGSQSCKKFDNLKDFFLQVEKKGERCENCFRVQPSPEQILSTDPLPKNVCNCSGFVIYKVNPLLYSKEEEKYRLVKLVYNNYEINGKRGASKTAYIYDKPFNKKEVQTELSRLNLPLEVENESSPLDKYQVPSYKKIQRIREIGGFCIETNPCKHYCQVTDIYGNDLRATLTGIGIIKISRREEEDVPDHFHYLLKRKKLPKDPFEPQ